TNSIQTQSVSPARRPPGRGSIRRRRPCPSPYVDDRRLDHPGRGGRGGALQGREEAEQPGRVLLDERGTDPANRDQLLGGGEPAAEELLEHGVACDRVGRL